MEGKYVVTLGIYHIPTLFSNTTVPAIPETPDRLKGYFQLLHNKLKSTQKHNLYILKWRGSM